MNYNFSNDKPIYLQLMEIFVQGIVSNELPPGSKVDSVRDLALAAKVNPNTMQKALSELERLGLLRTERNSGRFITDDETRISELKQNIACKEIQEFIKKMSSFGFSKQELITLIQNQKEEI